MDQMTPMTVEAKMLNLGGYELADKLSAADAHNERMMLTLYLPPGRLLDRAQLDQITSGAQSWAPMTVRRQLLAEAGARAIGQAMILAPSELERLRQYARMTNGRHTHYDGELWRAIGGPISPYPR